MGRKTNVEVKVFEKHVEVKRIKVQPVGHAYGFYLPKNLVDYNILTGDKEYLLVILEMPASEIVTPIYMLQKAQIPKALTLIRYFGNDAKGIIVGRQYGKPIMLLISGDENFSP